MKFTKRHNRRLSILEGELSALRAQLHQTDRVAHEARNRPQGMTQGERDSQARTYHAIHQLANDAHNRAEDAYRVAHDAADVANGTAKAVIAQVGEPRERPVVVLEPGSPSPLEPPRDPHRYEPVLYPQNEGWHRHGDNLGQHRHQWGSTPHDKMAHEPLDLNDIEYREAGHVVFLPEPRRRWWRR